MERGGWCGKRDSGQRARGGPGPKGEVKAAGFSKADRILKRGEFVHLSKLGRRVHNAYFIAAVLPGATGRHRLGITVTRRVGCATQRNRVKRLSREFFRKHKEFLKGVWDINLIAKQGVTRLDSKAVCRHLSHIFNGISKGVGH